MNKNLGVKLIVIIAVLLLFVYGIFGIPSGFSGSALLASLQNRISLGLDLKGGTHLILQVKVNDAVNIDTDNAIQTLKSGMRNAKINYTDLTSGANNTYTVTMKPTNLTDLKNRAVQQAIETIRNRIDQLGVSEPMIEEHGVGDYQILVQLPGIDDPARVKQVMQSTAMLEIRQVMGGPYPS